MVSFRRLKTGDVLDGNISARAYNRMLDLIERLQTLNVGSGRSGYQGLPVLAMQASTPFNVDITNVVKITSPGFDPAVDAEKFQTIPIVNVGNPTGRGNFAVVAGSIPAGDIGTVIVSGITPVRIDVVHASHTHADLIASDITKLRSGFTGHAKILWKEAGTGVKHALIQFPVADQGTVFGKPVADINPGASGDVTVWINGLATTATVTGHLTWMHGGEKVSGGKQVELTWSALDEKWIITGAECEA